WAGGGTSWSSRRPAAGASRRSQRADHGRVASSSSIATRLSGESGWPGERSRGSCSRHAGWLKRTPSGPARWCFTAATMAQSRPRERMRAMVLEEAGRPLAPAELAVPHPQTGQLLVRVHACGVCRTDLHLLDGEVPVSSPPRVLGHQIVGTVIEGEEPLRGSRVGIPWLGWTCGECEWCRSGRENLCPRARFTGRDSDGGMAEYPCARGAFGS